jgi:hypothetical protein
LSARQDAVYEIAAIRKYPRTPHLEGSRLQPGDEDLDLVPSAALAGAHVVVEEKLDGANVGISVGADGRLRLQSRGHVLTGGPRERQFDLLKTWAACHQDALASVLGDQYVMYGEWLYARHTVFYDALPHYFHEFDVLDLAADRFLSTERRRALLAGLPIVSVPVLFAGAFPGTTALRRLIGPSHYKSPRWQDRLAKTARGLGLDPSIVAREADASSEMEGLYLKVERDGQVVERAKLVRGTFLTAILESGSHWLDRPIVPNQLRDGADLYAPTLPTSDQP